jgi:hypothetical protein
MSSAAHALADTGSREAAMTAALHRLYCAAASQIDDIVTDLSESERAQLAVFCYGRAHLNAIGLSVAATCDVDQLIVAASSSTAGRTIYAQSRALPAEKPQHGRRNPVTLARSAGAHRFLQPDFDVDVAADIPA